MKDPDVAGTRVDEKVGQEGWKLKKTAGRKKQAEVVLAGPTPSLGWTEGAEKHVGGGAEADVKSMAKVAWCTADMMLRMCWKKAKWKLCVNVESVVG